MRRALMLSTTFALAGCGAFLSLTGDDDDDPGPSTGVGIDASSGTSTADGASAVDGSADGAGLDANANADASTKLDSSADAAPSLLVFVTSSQYAGDKLGSPDALCMTAKGALPGEFRAWLSHPLRQAANVITGDGPWRLSDGTLVATNKAQLLSGQLLHAIDLDENGNVPNGVDGNVWTGTSEQGSTLFHCNQWKQADGGLQGTYGVRSASSKEWTNSGEVSCLSTMRLYCFQIAE